MENCINVTLGRGECGPCPNCGGSGHIPQGVFNIIGETIHILSAPERTTSELLKLSEIIKESKKSTTPTQTVINRVTNEVPNLKPLLQFLPNKNNRTEMYAFFALILAFVQICLSLSSEEETPKENINININANQLINEITINQ